MFDISSFLTQSEIATGVLIIAVVVLIMAFKQKSHHNRK